jgi:type III secretion apparatus needle protein
MPAVTTLSMDNVYNTFATNVATASTNLETAITDAASGANPNDPVNMIKMQKELANYSMSLQVQSSVVKSIEETAKSITQKL